MKQIGKILALLLVLAMTASCIFGQAEQDDDFIQDAATETDLTGDEESWEQEEPESLIAYTADGETLEIAEDADAEGENCSVTAVFVNSQDGAVSTVNVGGSVTALGTADSVSHQTSAGMEIYTAGEGSEANVTVGEGITSVMKWTNPEEGDNINCGGLSITVEDGGSVMVTVEDGGIYAEATGEDPDGGLYTWAAGVHLYNTDGAAEITVNGDVTAESAVYGVGLNSHMYGEEGSTLIEVNGDVYGTTRGIWAEQSNSGGTMEIVVNGTVSGEVDNVMVDGENRDLILLTVWKIEPDQNGNLICMPGPDEDPDNLIRAEEAEKALQYIIRVVPAAEEMIEAEAAEYRGYRVAREGEKVRIRVAAPAGSEIVSVFADEDQAITLERDADGSYILSVPRGGGVALSVLLRETPKNNSSKSAAAAPGMIITEDSTGTAALKDALTDTADLAAILPENVLEALSAGSPKIRETLTLTLVHYTEEAGTLEFILPVAQTYRDGEKVRVAFALPGSGDTEWFVTEGTGTADGKLSVRPDMETLKSLAGQTFLAVVLSTAE